MHRRQIGAVFQDHQLLFDRSVGDNVALPLQIAEFPHAEIKRRVRAALHKVGLLRKEKYSPAHLSGGEQQRVGIARAVVNRPHIILADEPTGNVDDMIAVRLLYLFEELNRMGTTVVIATHNEFLVNRFRHPQLHLEGGRLDTRPPSASN